MTTLALLVSIILGTASLSWGYAEVGLEPLSRWLLAFGALWLFAVWRRWRWFASMGLAVSFLAAALGLWFLDFPPGWMFGGVVLALLAWDLTYFRYRLRFAATEAECRFVESRHLVRVSLLAILGFGLSSLAMAVRVRLDFRWITFLAIVVALGLSQIIHWFRSRA